MTITFSITLLVVVGLAVWVRHLRAALRHQAAEHRKQVLSMLDDAARIEWQYRKELTAAKEGEKWAAMSIAYQAGFKDGLMTAKKAVRQAAAAAATSVIDELLKK